MWHSYWKVLGKAASRQGQHQAEGEPTRRFLELLAAAIASGQAHVAAPDGGMPGNAQRWGWRFVDDSKGGVWRAFGDRVGWVDGDDFYLEREVSYRMAQRMARDAGDVISIGVETLQKGLHEKGVLATTDKTRNTLTVRRRLAGTRRNALHLEMHCT